MLRKSVWEPVVLLCKNHYVKTGEKTLKYIYYLVAWNIFSTFAHSKKETE